MNDLRALPIRRIWRLAGLAVCGLLVLHKSSDTSLIAQCGPNPIVCENQLPGNAPNEWDINGAGDPTLQGFATDISVNKGSTVHFKIDTTASSVQIDIYRLGYYGGLGARLIANLGTFAGQQQNACLTSATTGLIDCGNWLETASWPVPATAVSGVYLARLTRPDTGGASHIVFIVRDDAAQADVLFQTSDTTWQAYNQYGGNSLYVGGPGTNPGRAYKVSYNRPFTTRGTGPEDFLFNAEYPMIRWLEANGFNVSYFTGVDTDRSGATELPRHRVFLSVGHDEYWSGGQRANVEAARAAGVNLAFFSGNEVFWKTRWEPSIDGSNKAYRTLVSYKETHASAVIDPLDPPTWTGTWRDPRFSPPADGGRPENALTGTIFTVNCCSTGAAITVADTFSSAPFWRNTRVATLPPGGSTSLAAGTLGYEWDENLDNGFRPAGLASLSSTTLSVSQKLQDYGHTYGPGTATHELTLYRHASGALVFGAGTVQWSWGLDGVHDRGGSTPDLAMQQATVNLLFEMAAQPGSLQPGLVPGWTGDTTPPTVTITAPAAGATVSGSTTVTANANDNLFLAGVQFQIDGVNLGPELVAPPYSTAWNTTTLSNGSHTVRAIARDVAGNTTMSSPVSVVVSNTGCPCSVWPLMPTPAHIETTDKNAVELGMRFKADTGGTVTAVRYYKASTNTGTHTGHLWSNTGTLLGSVTFTDTPSGWQQANFATPIAIAANTTYVVSYYAPAGSYAADNNYFAVGVDTPPLHAPADGVAGANGVYRYGSSGFPTSTWQASNYWVDVVFVPNAGVTVPTITNLTQAAASSALTSAGLTTGTVTTAASATVPAGLVISQNPAAGSVVAAGSAVSFVVSTGPATVTVPNVVNLTQAAASSALTSAGLTTGTVTTAASATVAAGLVISQNPAAGTAVATGSAVSFVVSTGPAPVTVPNVVNLTQAAATTAITSAGLVVGTVTTTASATVPAGLVISQTPGAGTSVAPGSAVNLVVSSGPPVGGCPCSLWSAAATPAAIETGDTNAVELGMRFTADVSGTITGVRFYKGASSSSPHIANLWSGSGTLLATATFVNETASGWQQVSFSTPVAIAANTTYVVSYHSPNGNYAVDNNYFAVGLDTPPLHAPADGVGGANGVYHYGSSGFPTDTWQASNYWVDVIFTPGP